MAWTEFDLAALDAALKRGVRVVQFGDRSITYVSTSEMLAVRKLIQAELSGSRNNFRYSTPDFSDPSASGSFDQNS